MQKFWYHSPVRFYKNREDLFDMTNPQNTQFFGSKNPYPLEISAYHRYLIPNYQNEIPDIDLELWLVNDRETKIPCEFGISNGKLFRITFIFDQSIAGAFEIRTISGETLFYSNCIQFKNTDDGSGRKHIRIATKHYYNRNLFAYDGSQYDWMITNLPAYCLGQFGIDSDISTSRTGGNNTLTVNEAYSDEIVNYEFKSEGDCNIVSFVQSHITNNEFYIDGTKRTATEKVDVDEFGMFGKVKFTNVKDKNGLNIILDELEVMSDAIDRVLGNGSKNIVYGQENNLIKTN